MGNKTVYTLLFMGWMLFITVASLVRLDGLDTDGIRIPHADKLVHAVFYGGMVVFGVCMGFQYKPSPSIKSKLWFWVIAAVIYGMIIEVLQNQVFMRDGDVFDALANTFGALLGALSLSFLFNRLPGLKWKD